MPSPYIGVLLTILTGKNCFIQFSTRMAGWLLPTFFICLHNQLSSITHSIITYQEHRCLKNVIHQIDSKNDWLVLPASFNTKFGLFFVLTLENAFSQRFHFKSNRKSIGFSKKRYYGFSIQLSVREIVMVLCNNE